MDVFIITSVINTGDAPWSYTSVRSVYTCQQRYEQTLKSIQSIRDLNDGTFIVLSECSEISTEMTEELRCRVDLFVQSYDNETIRNACINSAKKGYGEVLQSLAAVESLNRIGMPFRRIFKLSGRYFLNNYFDKNNFSLDMYTFTKGARQSTVLYSVPYNLMESYVGALSDCAKLYEHNVIALEDILPPRCKPAKYIDCCGMAGCIGIVDCFISFTPDGVLESWMPKSNA